MEKIKFTKYQGTGNDFIIIDNRSNAVSLNTDQIHELCKRKWGIGADGLILLQESDQYDFKMLYFNADGKEGSMCGNGGRCIVHYAHELKLFDQHCRFEAIDGLHEATIRGNSVCLNMKEISEIKELPQGAFFVDTGSPHYVKYVHNLDSFEVYQEGKSVRHSEAFRESGTNVNFIEKKEDILHIRTYERGVEEETLSCGTGAVASALVAHVYLNFPMQIQVHTLGGKLNVSFRKEEGYFKQVQLEGEVQQVFEGYIPTKYS